MAKKKRLKTTPDEHAWHEESHRMALERIAYHEAKAREEEQARDRAERHGPE